MTAAIPAEWAPHRAMWVGWPTHGEYWFDHLDQARDEVEGLVRALAGPGREQVKLMVGGQAALADAQARFAGVENVEVVAGTFGDVWLRDTGPIFAKKDGADVAQGFRFNGWGGKYDFPYDDEVAGQIAAAAGVMLNQHEFILEGGAVDHDGAGTVLTTGQCVLNPNRNAGWTQSAAEAAFAAAFGATKTIWLGEGLANDHTDGHVDNLARFVAPGVAVCPIGFGRGDVNLEAYDDAARRLAEATDAQGRKLKVVRVPSPGWIEGVDGRAAPASHMNFIIANGAVIMPTYGEGQAADLALQALESVFPDRKVIGLPSTAVLTGGGSFHCITQQEPA